MKLKLKGKFRVQHIRDGKVIGEFNFHNDITDVGVNYLLETGFHNGTKTTPWYIGLIDNAGTPTEHPADTMASHVWTEFKDYSEGARQTWLCNTAGGRAIINTSVATFTINGTGVVYGLFLVAASEWTDASSLLWCTGAFTAPRSVVAADTIKVIYSLDA